MSLQLHWLTQSLALASVHHGSWKAGFVFSEMCSLHLKASMFSFSHCYLKLWPGRLSVVPGHPGDTRRPRGEHLLHDPAGPMLDPVLARVAGGWEPQCNFSICSGHCVKDQDFINNSWNFRASCLASVRNQITLLRQSRQSCWKRLLPQQRLAQASLGSNFQILARAEDPQAHG